MPYVDSHCHIHLDPLCLDIAAAIRRATEQQITHMLCVSVSLEDIKVIEPIMKEYRGVVGSVGVHPNEKGPGATLYDDLVRLARKDRIVAIGETGLDYYRSGRDSVDVQQESFRQHIAAARTTRKPLIIHTREAPLDTLQILREEGASDVGGVIHCFTETEAFAREALALNFYISFSGILTFKNAQNLRDIAAWIPEDRVLIETDSPYLAPVPFRGKANEPAYVRHVAQCLADVRHVPIDRIGENTSRNFFTLFKDAA